MPFPATLPSPDVLTVQSRNLAAIWTVLTRGIGAWIGRRPATPIQMLVMTRAGKLVSRLQAILALLAEGQLPRSHPPRPTRPQPAPAAAAPENPPPKPRTPSLPRRVGWLMGRDVGINGAASQLRHWLADPAIQAVLAEVPQARRPLLALCRMLAIPPWPLDPQGPLPVPKPRVRKPRPRKPRRETLAELRASVWHHRCIETDDGLVRPGKRPWWMPTMKQRRQR